MEGYGSWRAKNLILLTRNTDLHRKFSMFEENTAFMQTSR